MYPLIVLLQTILHRQQDGDVNRRLVCDALSSPGLFWSILQVFCLCLSHRNNLDATQLANEVILL